MQRRGTVSIRLSRSPCFLLDGTLSWQFSSSCGHIWRYSEKSTQLASTFIRSFPKMYSLKALSTRSPILSGAFFQRVTNTVLLLLYTASGTIPSMSLHKFWHLLYSFLEAACLCLLILKIKEATERPISCTHLCSLGLWTKNTWPYCFATAPAISRRAIYLCIELHACRWEVWHRDRDGDRNSTGPGPGPETGAGDCDIQYIGIGMGIGIGIGY